ncbi:DNA-3-methyladenine glycosylase 2 family protein [Baekduia soli]|uniref:DNA-3-methyladenine glycosylase 2 family protein n=1 Tax=Baekduia soli TaxID=496014 RepID=A0A5B8UAR0_9ACTN|nr:DNA-3-methyladenine glycosylase [Baekduia soli]QEC50160.1 DNA-3-methyladenine glycosylase 2 family protein [Baekduia soli]
MAPPGADRVEVRREIRPPWPFRLRGGGGLDGVLRRRRGGVLERVLHVDDAPAVVRVAQPSAGHVIVGARAARRDVAEEAVARMRFALGVDEDLRPFYERWRDDPLIGPSVRARPHLRVARRPEPFEALAWAICEQLIEYDRAAAIERAILHRLGRRAPDWDGTGTLHDLPAPSRLAGTSPALLQSLDLSAGRSLALVRVAREVACGRVDLRDPDHERGWARLRRIPGVGAWTVEVLALHGQGRHDQLPAGDLAFLKLVGRLRSGGDPAARAGEDDVRALFAPYAGWRGLAAAHALGPRATGGGAALRFAA